MPQFVLGGGKADLEALDFTRPAVAAGFCDPVGEVLHDLGQPATGPGVEPEHRSTGHPLPLLQINPKMLPRLDELEADLLHRLKRARAEQWLGEIDGINLTLTFLRAKRRKLSAPTDASRSASACQRYVHHQEAINMTTAAKTDVVRRSNEQKRT